MRKVGIEVRGKTYFLCRSCAEAVVLRLRVPGSGDGEADMNTS